MATWKELVDYGNEEFYSALEEIWNEFLDKNKDLIIRDLVNRIGHMIFINTRKEKQDDDARADETGRKNDA